MALGDVVVVGLGRHYLALSRLADRDFVLEVRVFGGHELHGEGVADLHAVEGADVGVAFEYALFDFLDHLVVVALLGHFLSQFVVGFLKDVVSVFPFVIAFLSIILLFCLLGFIEVFVAPSDLGVSIVAVNDVLFGRLELARRGDFGVEGELEDHGILGSRGSESDGDDVVLELEDARLHALGLELSAEIGFDDLVAVHRGLLLLDRRFLGPSLHFLVAVHGGLEAVGRFDLRLVVLFRAE